MLIIQLPVVLSWLLTLFKSFVFLNYLSLESILNKVMIKLAKFLCEFHFTFVSLNYLNKSIRLMERALSTYWFMGSKTLSYKINGFFDLIVFNCAVNTHFHCYSCRWTFKKIFIKISLHVERGTVYNSKKLIRSFIHVVKFVT